MRPTAIHPLKILAAVGVAFLLWGLLLAYASSPAWAAEITVNTTANSGAGSLPQAILDANANAGADTISFQEGLSGTIGLASTLEVDAGGLTIDGAGANITVSGGGSVRVFKVTSGGNLTLNKLTVANGHADGDEDPFDEFGGGAATLGGTLTISNSTFSDNSAFTGGGGVATTEQGTVIVTDSTFSDNIAEGGSGGGGIYNQNSSTTVTNSTFSNNTTPTAGGGINNSNDSTLTVTSSTFSGNSAGAGGGIWNNNVATLKNTIVAENSADFEGPDVRGAFTSQGYNLIGDGTDSTGFTQAGDQVGTADKPINPMLGPLADNGGPTKTHALLTGSPAIDAIPSNASGCGTDFATDQRGVARPKDGDTDGTAACDIGAFELVVGDCQPSGSDVECTFDSPGISTWKVPEGITQATFDVFGAQGGNETRNGHAGGLGGKASATIVVTPGATLQVNVGGRGGDGVDQPAGGDGGFNGGADGGNGCNSGPGGGGGASDVRSGDFGLADRIIVGGGGGGAGGFGGGAGGYGGGSEDGPESGPGAAGVNGGEPGGGGGGGGTSTEGGAGGDGQTARGDEDGDDGGIGTGGSGGSDPTCPPSTGFNDVGGGGGGGGYYGGGGGGGGFSGGGGGGGSGFGPSGVVFQSGVQPGDGLVKITYTEPNTAPTAVDDGYSTNEDTLLTGDVLSNDSDDNGDTLGAALVSGPSHAATNGFTLNQDGSFSYTPASNYNGPDSFTYKVSDGKGGEDTATVSISVTPVNDAPEAHDDSATTAEDTPINIAVLSNDTDVEGDTLSVSNLDATSDQGGTLSKNADGTLKYTPAANYNGPDSFTYETSDGSLQSKEATVSITVTSVNDPPTVNVAAGGACGTNDRSGRINLTVNDPDTPAEAPDDLTASSSNKTLVPDANLTFSGPSASPTLNATALSGKTGTATITVTVTDDDNAKGTVALTLQAGGNSNDTLTGTSANDVLNGTILSGTDILLGQNGDDTLSGVGGNDLLCGGRGNDNLTGGVTGVENADRFGGGKGTDIVTDFTPSQGDTEDGTIENF